MLASTAIAFTLAACSTASRHRTIIYDQPWSSAASVKNLVCVPEQRASCEQRARETEMAFSKTLSTTFRTSPECATVQFLISKEEGSLSDGLAAKLANVMGSGYWRLRVDFRPGLTSQPFTLGLAKSVPRIAGDDVEHSAAFICNAAKANGVTAIWQRARGSIRRPCSLENGI
jgi:hypothetical protein